MDEIVGIADVEPTIANEHGKLAVDLDWPAIGIANYRSVFCIGANGAELCPAKSIGGSSLRLTARSGIKGVVGPLVLEESCVFTSAPLFGRIGYVNYRVGIPDKADAIGTFRIADAGSPRLALRTIEHAEFAMVKQDARITGVDRLPGCSLWRNNRIFSVALKGANGPVWPVFRRINRECGSHGPDWASLCRYAFNEPVMESYRERLSHVIM